jgi:hypothetical protein
MGSFEPSRTTVASPPSFDVRHTFDHGSGCEIEGVDDEVARKTIVDLRCCRSQRDSKKGLHIKSVVEVSTCSYLVVLCVPTLCSRPQSELNNNNNNNRGGGDSLTTTPPTASNAVKEARESDRLIKDEQFRVYQQQKAGKLHQQQQHQQLGGGGAAGVATSARPPSTSSATSSASNFNANTNIMDASERLVHRESVRAMFVTAWDAYMYHAWPHGELAPLSCSGKAFDMIKV